MALLANGIFQGDCILKLGELERGSVDLVFADPPFNIGYEYDVYHDQRSRDDFLQFSRKWMSAVAAALKPTGTFWLAIGDEYAAELKLIAQNDIGLTCRSWVIWYYTFGVNCVRGFSRSHTHLFHFVKDPKQYTFNSHNPAVRVPSARQLVYADGRANSKGRLPDNTWIFRPQDVPSPGFSPLHDTWYFSRVAGTFSEREGFHGCQMPEQLLGRIIKISSNAGDLVVDPFAGSGTTLAVAKKLGRRWIGIELSSEYVKRIQGRIDACRTGDLLDGPSDPVGSAPKTSRGKRRGRLRNGRLVLSCDADTRNGIIDAYKTSCQGYSTDFVLCNPEQNQEFLDACRRNSLAGDAFNWNRLLLRVRKSGKLPKVDKSPKRLRSIDMDAYSPASEVAMRLLSLDFEMTLDDILCSPDAAAEFDRLAARFVPGFNSFEYRWAALAIRKRAKKSRLLAMETSIQKQLAKGLPRCMSLDECISEQIALPGVYVLMSANGPLYVGETFNVKERVRQIRETDSWIHFQPESLRFITGRDRHTQYGIQSLLIGKTNSPLNSQLLRPDYMPVA